MGLEPGDTVFVRVSRSGLLEMRKAINPFDRLAEEAVRQYRARETKNIEDLAAELGVELDSDD